MTKLDVLTPQEEHTWITTIVSRQTIAISLIFDKVEKYLKDEWFIENIVGAYKEWNITMKLLAELFLPEEF